MTKARALAQLRARMVELDAPATSIAQVATYEVSALLETDEHEAVREVVADALRLTGVAAELRIELQLHLADVEIHDERFEAARGLIDLTQDATLHPDVRSLLADDGAAPANAAPSAATINALHWFSVRCSVDLRLGRPDRAETFLAPYALLARRIGDGFALWDAFDLAVQCDFAFDDYAAVASRVKQARESREFEGGEPELQRRLDVFEALARYELERRSDPSDASAGAALAAILDAPDAGAQTRAVAAMGLAKLGVETGSLDLADKAIAFLRESVAASAPHQRQSLRVEIDALDMRRAAMRGEEPAALRAALERLETSFRGFLDAWSEVTEKRNGVAFMHFGDRYLALSELVSACLLVDGPESGALRALRWIDATQRLGGLARDLARESPPDVERDLADLAGEHSGVILYQPGRSTTHLFLIDASGIDVVEVAPSWKLIEDCNALTAATSRAVHRGSDRGDPDVRSALAAFARDAVTPAALVEIAGWREMTVIGDESFGHMTLDLIELADGRRLGDVVAIGYAPSISVGAALTRRARSRAVVPEGELDVRIVAIPTPPAGASGALAEELAIGLDVFERWSRRFARPAQLRLGGAATAESLVRAGGEGFDAVQVVAHGRHDSTQECSAGLQLADSAAGVWSQEIEAGAAPRLVLLAVCGASLKGLVRGDDGRTGLAASFVVAGADCVVQTPADLEAQQAVAFFERVTQRIASGDSPARALARARQDTAAQDGEVALQSYLVHAWGAPHVAWVPSAAADPEPRERSDRSRLVLVALAAATLLGLAAWTVRARRST